ncbi:MAG: phosphomethylpyrimidine kinase [candidate division WOR-3 bacterium]|nr:phosphomethylpyrimidine kinase [candidate division WOR-3 bacterium]MDH5683987.1 phosphomethylpyrimidine kinase [candidate division WOR-3 bacterium]
MPQESERVEVLDDLKEAVRVFQKCKQCSLLMPEVRMNLVYSINNPKTIKDVAAVDGRITVVKDYPKAAGEVIFGASDHMARLIVELKKYDPEVRAGINFKFDKKLLEYIAEYCAKRNMKLGRIDRTKEPVSVREENGMSMPWKVKNLVEECGGIVPKIFYETEGWGKEPLFVLVGKDPTSVVEKLLDITGGYIQWMKTQG